MRPFGGGLLAVAELKAAKPDAAAESVGLSRVCLLLQDLLQLSRTLLVCVYYSFVWCAL
jgi:hypothetical protein